MKFHLLSVLILCIWLGQICAGSDKQTDEQIIRDNIYAVGEQFVEDLVNIGEKYENNFFIEQVFGRIISRIIQVLPKNSKADVNHVKNVSSSNDVSSALKNIFYDHVRVCQLILSQQFPPERYNGAINLIFVYTFDCVTTDEIQSVLNYMYGHDTEATKTSFLDSHNFPKPTNDSDCHWYLRISPIINSLSRMVGVKPKVTQDFLAIREQFLCNEIVVESLIDFVNAVRQLGGHDRKINACMIKERQLSWKGDPDDPNASKNYVERDLKTIESVLTTRLPDETIRGVINFRRAINQDIPIDEIEKALEYLYEDVPKTDCNTTEISTLKAD